MSTSRKSLAFNLIALVAVVTMTAKMGMGWSTLVDIGVGAVVGLVVLYLSQRQGEELERRIRARRLEKKMAAKAQKAPAALTAP